MTRLRRAAIDQQARFMHEGPGSGRLLQGIDTEHRPYGPAMKRQA